MAALMAPPVLLILQLLVSPVTDNTASSTESVYPSWSENTNTCGLVPDRMLWFRNLYLSNEADRTKWDNSPMCAPDETFQKVPNAWIGVCERDILRDEGVFYGEKMRKFGKTVDVVVYQNAPHAILAMDGKQTLILCWLFSADRVNVMRGSAQGEWSCDTQSLSSRLDDRMLMHI